MARPKKIIENDKIKKQLQILAEHGFTNDELAAFFGLARSTVYELLKEEWFSDSLKNGKKFADDRVEKSLYERACGYSVEEEELKIVSCGANLGSEVQRHKILKHYPPDVTACIFWLKNRRASEWREKQEIGFDENTVNALANIFGMTDENKNS